MSRKNNRLITIGILYLYEKAFTEGRRMLEDAGFTVKVIEPNERTSRLDYLYIPEFEGMNTNSLAFRDYNVPPEYPPVSNRVQYFFDSYKSPFEYYVAEGIKILGGGNAFYTCMGKYKRGDNHPYKLKIENGVVGIDGHINAPAEHHPDHGWMLNTESFLVCEDFYISDHINNILLEKLEPKPQNLVVIV